MKTELPDLTPKAREALVFVARSLIGQKGGLTKSAKKARSSAANGRKFGGRPKKTAV